MYDESHIGNKEYSYNYVCPHCGYDGTDYDGYCVKCGEKVVNYNDSPSKKASIKAKRPKKKHNIVFRVISYIIGAFTALFVLLIIIVSIQDARERKAAQKAYEAEAIAKLDEKSKELEEELQDKIDQVLLDAKRDTQEDMLRLIKENGVEFDYESMARNPEAVNKKYAIVTGKVLQVQEEDTQVFILMNITENELSSGDSYWTDTVFVTYERLNSSEDRILENDIIKIYGQLNNTFTYTSIVGKSITVPRIDAYGFEILK